MLPTACWRGVAPRPQCRAWHPSSPLSQRHPNPQSIEVPARLPVGQAAGASHQDVPSGEVRASRHMLVGKLRGAGGWELTLVRARSLLCPPPLLLWEMALENGCLLPEKTLAGARARDNGFAYMWCLQQCCVGVLEVAGFAGIFLFPLFAFLWGKEKLLAGRLQVHRYLLLISLLFFFSPG